MDYSSWLAEGDVTISGNNNPWSLGGAVFLNNEASWVTYGNTVLSNNKANITGGAVALNHTSVWRTFGPVTISGNRAIQSGGGEQFPFSRKDSN